MTTTPSERGPVHHLGDKAALFTLAAEGFDLLAQAVGKVAEAGGSFRDQYRLCRVPSPTAGPRR